MKAIFCAIFVVLFCVTTLNAAEYFSDGFENTSTDSSPNYKDPASGAQWTGSAWTEVVDSTLSNVTPHSGSKMLRFRWEENANSEQRFDLGSQQTGDVYIRYYVYYPDGTELGENKYEHRDGPSSDNNKLMRLWGEDYDDNIKVGARSWPADEYVERIQFTANVSAWKVNGCSGSQGEAYINEESIHSWYRGDSTLGRWMCFEFHYKRDTGNSDGVFEFWVDGDKKIGVTNFSIIGAPCDPGYFKEGYLMGWANSGFDNPTNVYIDDVVFSDSYIGPISPQSPPEPPSNLRIKK